MKTKLTQNRTTEILLKALGTGHIMGVNESEYTQIKALLQKGEYISSKLMQAQNEALRSEINELNSAIDELLTENKQLIIEKNNLTNK